MENQNDHHRVRFIACHLFLVACINLALLALTLSDHVRLWCLFGTAIYPLLLLLGEDAQKPGRKKTLIVSSVLVVAVCLVFLFGFLIFVIRSANMSG